MYIYILRISVWVESYVYIYSYYTLQRDHRYHLHINQGPALDKATKTSRSRSAKNSVSVDPLSFSKCSTPEAESTSSAKTTYFSPTMPCGSAMSSPGQSYHVWITEEHVWKAMEIAVLCNEYGNISRNCTSLLSLVIVSVSMQLNKHLISQ